MGLLIRERPPLALDVGIQVGGGVAALPYRWAADDPSAAKKPDGLSFTTTMPGGFEQLNCTLERDPRLDYPDLVEMSTVTVRGLGGAQVAWQGRLEEFPSTAGAQAQIQPQVYGHQNALSDDSSAAMIYIDQDLTKWGGPSLGRQIAALGGNFQLGNSQILADPSTNLPVLDLEFDGAYATPYMPFTEAWYPAGDSGDIAVVYYALDWTNPGGASWNHFVLLCSDDVATINEPTANLAGGASGYFAPATPYPYALVQHYFGASPSGVDNATYPSYWKLAVYGDHGLTLHGSSDPKGVLASDVIAHALTNWAPEINFTTGSNGTIKTSSFVIPQLVFTPTTVATMIQQAVQYELLDWAVWEGQFGPTMYVNQRGGRGKSWVSRVGPAQLQQAGPQASRIYNGVIVQFTAVDGTTQTAGPPGSGCTITDASLVDTDPMNPANEAGITKWAPLPMGTTTPAGAIQVGGKFLTEQAQIDTAGQASLVGHVQDTNGAWWPAWMVRAGDSISFVDASVTAPRRIVSTSYDGTTKTNAINLDQPPDSIAALLQRMSIDISPLGLS